MSYFKLKSTHRRSEFSWHDALIWITIIGAIAGMFIPLFIGLSSGVGGFGPIRSVDATVQSLYVDRGSSSSHYMVGTDAGVFEVDNGILLGVWNSDEIYSKLVSGHRYRFTTEGNRSVGFWLQEYPYITKAEEITK